MSGLSDLLDVAAGEPGAFDVGADLRRGRRAAARRRSHRAVGATACLVAAAAVGVTAWPRGSGGDQVPQVADGPALVHLQYYDVPTPPSGWHIVGERPQYVMITRDGSGVTSVDSGFVGQIVVMLTSGDPSYDEIFKQPSVQYDGRAFYSNGTQGGLGMTTLSVRTADGSWLQLQYPYADFGQSDMVAYLDAVVVEPGAVPGDQPVAQPATKAGGAKSFHVIHKNGRLYYVAGKQGQQGVHR
jgi:hypothetical protein